MKKVTKKELVDLLAKVEWEGFGYYMLDYGPDLKLIERMGFNKKEVEAAIKLFKDIENKIMEGEEYIEEYGDK